MFRIAMLRRVALACPAALLALAASAGAAPHAALRAPRTATPPLTFERNTGHWPGEVQFVARSGQGMLFLTKREIVLSLRKGDKAAALRLKRRGSNPKAVASGLEKQPGIVNYFIGNDPKKWRTKVPTYSRARLAGVYPGIDLVTYGADKSRTLEYDFVVKPGEDPKQIRMTVSGARSLRTADGKLIASTSCGDVTLNRPYAYQTVNGVRKQVACSFSLERNTVAFQIARYDASRPLVVDPTLEYCTFLGGDATDNAYGVALDAAGAAIVCGRSYSAAFPTTSGVAQTSNGGGYDAFVTKLNSDGTALAFSAYLGGAGADQALAIAVDTAGVITVCGYTSGAFPTTTGAFQTAYGGGQDAFVTRLNAAGTELVYSTYLGKAGGDNANAIAVDSLGAAYVCGNTNGAFPTTPGAYDSTLGGSNDVFITKLNATGTALVYSTFVGSTGSDTGYGIAVDSAGSATVCGNTSTGAYPTTTGAFQTVRGGLTDGFVTRLNPDGTALVYSTYLGGLGADYPRAIAIGADGAVVIHGYTSSSDFPTTVGAYQTTRASGSDGFITKLDATGTALVYSTYLGGTSTEYSYGLALDAVGAPVVCGYVGGAGFPVTADALQATSGGAGDAYIAKLDASGATMLYGSYLGGSGGEYGLGVALDAAGAATVVGYTASTGFPTTAGAYQTTYGGGTFDGYVTKISFGATAQPTTITADAVTCYASDTITLTGTLTKTSDSSALSGKTILFKVDAGGTWTDAAAATGADGKATLSATAPATTGAHTIYVRFEADTDYAAS
ncbi:MAG: SBBP repeat-containing protein, partial [Armatimonadetes bacterium]|nr:SBBP repeat-containing protein [Armatimonadota bacterium]